MELNDLLPLVYKIRLISKRNTQYIDNRLKNYGMYHGDFQYLYIIYKNKGITQRELSKKLNLHESSVTRGIKRLERKEFIKTEKSNEDKRRNILSITSKGCEMLKINFKEQKSFEENIEKIFTPDELKVFEENLERIIKMSWL